MQVEKWLQIMSYFGNQDKVWCQVGQLWLQRQLIFLSIQLMHVIFLHFTWVSNCSNNKHNDNNIYFP